MVKYLFLAAALLVSSLGISQIDFGVWEKAQTNDEFGDPSGEYVTRYFAQGTFSNTATVGSELIAKVVLWPDGDASIDLYEYGRSKGVICSRGCSGTILVKMPDGSEENIPVYAGSGGMIIIKGSKVKQKAFLDALRNQTGEVRVVIRGTSFYQSYDRSTYNFKIQCMGGVEPQIEIEEAQPADSTKTE